MEAVECVILIIRKSPNSSAFVIVVVVVGVVGGGGGGAGWQGERAIVEEHVHCTKVVLYLCVFDFNFTTKRLLHHISNVSFCCFASDFAVYFLLLVH